MKYFLPALCITLSTSIPLNSSAETSPIAKIDHITVGESFARIHATQMMGVSNGVGNTCSDKSYYYLDLTDGKNKGQFSAILAAKAAQNDIAFQIDSGRCIGAYAEILHTYVY
ncbi:hypothetical protein P3339_08345 [Microbulbifer sp. MLAF003]|uniref:hypothetical protein n=1 Tax=unclassified Microbulbifer TaxID=2619833 RepID=UPI0024AD2BCB|nr:hypothetical protein [Microbulbifer sp. MLAF003]WHI52758.1 hypothetical protein P3339_08345 [Microbulbifer sp. MLAF003]